MSLRCLWGTHRLCTAFFFAAPLLMLNGCAAPASFVGEPGDLQTGKASYYHDSLHGHPTASGEPYDRNAFTAAHRSLPFGTEILVRNLRNGRSVRVRVNDRGPFVAGRIVDLSYHAVQTLDFLREGVADVTLKVITEGATSSLPSRRS
jgi:rare lipoprotein A